MILYELRNLNENDPVYRQLEFSNYARQLGFLNSVVDAALKSGKPFLSQTVIKALNYHAVACLHSSAGEYRPCGVRVGDFTPPEHHRVPDLMDDFVNVINRRWESSAPTHLSSKVLWRLNWIHPFINGNGRTARAACYFVLCLKSGGWLGGKNILPVLLRKNRERYVKALKAADQNRNVEELESLLVELLKEQAGS